MSSQLLNPASEIMTSLIAQENKVSKNYIDNILELYNEKCTIPFVSRYRKDQTGNMDEVQISKIYDAIKYHMELTQRKEFILTEIEKKGKLTPELKVKIESCFDAKKLEDLYLPYKEKKKTKAEKAKEAGIEPLAALLLSLKNQGDPEVEAEKYINTEMGYDTPEKVLEGALYIVSQKIIESTDLMESFLKRALQKGSITSVKKKGYKGDELRFEDYYEYEENISSLKQPKNSHRYLAIKRGESLKVLTLKTNVNDEENSDELGRAFIKPEHFYKAYLKKAADIAYQQYLRPALDTRIFSELSDTAENEAIAVFTRNLEAALLAPPLHYKNVLGLDPGIKTGIKAAILDKDGSFKGNLVIYINSANDVKKSYAILEKLINKFDIGAISIGNGTGSRETLAFVKNTLKQLGKDKEIITAVVNESGASVYSASAAAREEFPDLDVTVRGAISIGRRLQNPLAELVKIDPASIGVGQYQHDVDQKKLKEALTRVVEFCVNKVGVDLNTASYSILTYVSGLTEKLAKNLIQYRKEHGFFKSRAEVKKAKGIGPKTFEQCAGFLMIREGENPLDNTRVHPESYSIVKEIAKNHKLNVSQVIGNKMLLAKLNPKDYLTETCKEHNFKTILQDLMHPGQDPRKEFQNIKYQEGVETIDDLKEGMKVEGRVTNVTNFGAFIDIGVHQDGLCHISQLADRYISSPGEVVSVGDIITVEVIKVDKQKKRISLKKIN